MKIDPENVPDHSKPWIFDFENRFQRKIVPARTVLSLQDEIGRHAGLIAQAADSQNGLTRAMCCGHARAINAYRDVDIPVQIIVGPNDKVVCNEAARAVFGLLPAERGTFGKGLPGFDEWSLDTTTKGATVPMKDFVEVPYLDHGPFSNAFSIDTVIDVIRGWYDTHSTDDS